MQNFYLFSSLYLLICKTLMKHQTYFNIFSREISLLFQENEFKGWICNPRMRNISDTDKNLDEFSRRNNIQILMIEI